MYTFSQSIIFKNSIKFNIEKSVRINLFRYSDQFKSMLILRASNNGIVAEGYIRMLES